jgi:hypothetical protein
MDRHPVDSRTAVAAYCEESWSFRTLEEAKTQLRYISEGAVRSYCAIVPFLKRLPDSDAARLPWIDALQVDAPQPLDITPSEEQEERTTEA